LRTGKRSFLKASCAQLPEGVLLELGCRERRNGSAPPLPRLDLADREGGRLEIQAHGLGLGVVRDLDGRAIHLGQVGGKDRGIARLQVRHHRPVLLRLEGADRPLPLADQPQGHRLHPSRRKAAPNLLPQDRADLVAHEPIQDPPGLLGFDLLAVEATRVLERRLDGPLGDLVEDDPAHLPSLACAERLCDVPADGLALTIRVGGQVDGRGLLGGCLQLVQDLLACREGLVLGPEAPFDVHAQGLLGQIPDVSHGGLHAEVAPKVAVDGLRLRWRLDDDEALGQTGSLLPRRH